MKKLNLSVIGTLEQYRPQRPLFRRAMIEHKRNRRLSLGPHVSLYFEDYMTMKYQVQEMMYVEQLSGTDAIQEEIDVYNPLIPDGNNLKCTLMIEFPDASQRRQALRQLIGLERRVFLQVAGFEAVGAIANEDLTRSTPDKTAAVHFLRFEFTPAMIDAACQGARWIAFSDHPCYRHRLDPIPTVIAQSIARDFRRHSQAAATPLDMPITADPLPET